MNTWDERKRRVNLKDHGIDFADLEEFFDGDLLTREDKRHAYGEARYQTLGLLKARVIMVVHTESETVIRIISARKANKYEEETYFNEIQD